MNLKIFLQIAMILALLASTATIATADAEDPLTAIFSADITTGPAPLTVHFTDQSSGNPTEWHWSFGDDTYSTRQDPTHTFNAPGTYNVTLTIRDGYASNATTSQIIVTSAPRATPQPVIIVPVQPVHPEKPGIDKPAKPEQPRPDKPKTDKPKVDKPKTDKPVKPDQPKKDRPVKSPGTGKIKPIKDPVRNDGPKKQ